MSCSAGRPRGSALSASEWVAASVKGQRMNPALIPGDLWEIGAQYLAHLLNRRCRLSARSQRLATRNAVITPRSAIRAISASQSTSAGGFWAGWAKWGMCLCRNFSVGLERVEAAMPLMARPEARMARSFCKRFSRWASCSSSSICCFWESRATRARIASTDRGGWCWCPRNTSRRSCSSTAPSSTAA